MKPRTAPRASVVLLLAALLVAVLLGLAACSGSDSPSLATGDAGSTADRDGPQDPEAAGERGSMGFQAGDDAGDHVEGGAEVGVVAESAARETSAQEQLEVERSVIRKGDVALLADDVGRAQFEVQRVADRLGGQVTDEETTTGDEGDPAYTRIVLRIPTESFATAMADLKEIGELESAASHEVDVTAKVIDTRTRLAAQRRSIARITVLFDRAQSIRDIMRIESELSRRQADLESLQRQAAFLRGQTSMSTITVSIDRTPEEATPRDPDSDGAGFLTGLSAGWGALTASAVALATALGALLPWLVVLGVLGVPAWLVWRRRLRGRSSGRTPSAA